MLDKRCLSLLNIINRECVGTGYKIFATEDLLSYMPARFGLDKDSVLDCVKTLSEHEYISVKYQDDFEICLSPLNKGRLVFENQIDGEIEKARAQKFYFIYSFLGALIGGTFVIILFVLLGVI